jgi:flagellar operon protein
MSQIVNNPALVPPGVGPAQPAAPARPAKGAGGASDPAHRAVAPSVGPSFADTLAHAGQQLQFSKHALARVQRRGIELDPSTLGRLSQGVQRAASKGSRDSLVLVDGNAFVVSVSNRTVITAVGSEHMKDNVFTNIDSAVIA